MYFLIKDPTGSNPSDFDISEKYALYKYNGTVLYPTKMPPFKIKNGKVLTLPKPENLYYCLDTSLKGLIRSLGGKELLFIVQMPQDSSYECLRLEDDSFLVEGFVRSYGIMPSELPKINDQLSSFSWTMKFKNFYLKNFRSISLCSSIEQNSDNFMLITFATKTRMEIIQRIYANRNTDPDGKKVVSIDIPGDDYFNITETYNNTNGDYKLYINGILKHSVNVPLSSGNFNVRLSIQGLGLILSAKYNYDGNIQNATNFVQFTQLTPDDKQFDFYLRGFKKYDCILTPNDIKQIMKYDGII